MRLLPIRSMLLALVCLGALFTGSIAATSPTPTQTEKSVKVQKTEQTAVMQERTFTVEGAIMGQIPIPITTRNAFERFELPEAPARQFDHVPRV